MSKQEIYDKYNCFVLGYDKAIDGLIKLGMTEAEADNYLSLAVNHMNRPWWP